MNEPKFKIGDWVTATNFIRGRIVKVHQHTNHSFRYYDVSLEAPPGIYSLATYGEGNLTRFFKSVKLRKLRK